MNLAEHGPGMRLRNPHNGRIVCLYSDGCMAKAADEDSVPTMHFAHCEHTKDANRWRVKGGDLTSYGRLVLDKLKGAGFRARNHAINNILARMIERYDRKTKGEPESMGESTNHFHTPLKDSRGRTFKLGVATVLNGGGMDIDDNVLPGRICADCRSIYIERSVFQQLDEEKAEAEATRKKTAENLRKLGAARVAREQASLNFDAARDTLETADAELRRVEKEVLQ
jgi:hypothetical protein